MGKRLSYRMETAERNADVVSVSEGYLKYFLPIVVPCNYLTQVHKICVLDCLINWTAVRSILFLALKPSVPHIFRYSLLDPTRADQSRKMFLHHNSETSLEFTKQFPMLRIGRGKRRTRFDRLRDGRHSYA